MAISRVVDKCCTQYELSRSQYVAGLWKPLLPQQLLWVIASTDPRKDYHRASSWSWASCKAIVDYPYGLDKADDLVLVLVLNISYSKASPMLTISGAWKLQGRLCSLTRLSQYFTSPSTGTLEADQAILRALGMYHC